MRLPLRRRRSLPSAYLLPYHSDGPARRILLGTKNIVGRRIASAAVGLNNRDCTIPLGNQAALTNVVIWNSAGQRAICGGKRNFGETWLAAAQREFREETGIDFSSAAVRATYRVLAVANNPATAYLQNGSAARVAANAGPHYCCVFYKIDAAAADPLALAIRTAIANGTVADDELRAVDWVAPNATGFASLQDDVNHATLRPDGASGVLENNANWRAYYVHLLTAGATNHRMHTRDARGMPCTFNQYRAGRLGAAFDWFTNAVANLPP